MADNSDSDSYDSRTDDNNLSYDSNNDVVLTVAETFAFWLVEAFFHFPAGQGYAGFSFLACNILRAGTTLAHAREINGKISLTCSPRV